MSTRTKARKAALDLLFEAEQREMGAVVLLENRLEKPAGQAPLREYTQTLVRGVVAHTAEIDDTLGTYSQGWSLDRMPAVDRALLRIAAFEIMHCPDVPNAVAIDEAVSLAKELSTDESPDFINGLLSRVAQVAALRE